MSNEKKETAVLTKKEEYKISLETRELEIKLFWQRSLFFWGFISLAFVAFASLYDKYKGFALLISGFGVICSLVWLLANKGSKRWQENWESKVSLLEKELSTDLFDKVEPLQEKKNNLFNAKKYSVSKLVIALSWFVLIIWMIIFVLSSYVLIFDISMPKYYLLPYFAIFFFVFVVVYIIIILMGTKSSK